MDRHIRLAWLLSVLAHVSLVALTVFIGQSIRCQVIAAHPDAITVSSLELEPAASFELPLTRMDPVSVLESKTEPEVFEAVLVLPSETRRSEANAPAVLEEIGSPEGNGQVAAGLAHDVSAGSLDAVNLMPEGADVWSRIRGMTIGMGAPGAINGRGNQPPLSGQGGNGQGKDGVAGEGAGAGTAGATGTGRIDGAGANGASDVVLGVEPIKMDIGPYPDRARREGRGGLVKLRVEVLPDGHTGQVLVVASSMSDDLDRAACNAARNWRFKAAKLNGEPVAAWVRVPVRYELSGHQ